MKVLRVTKERNRLERRERTCEVEEDDRAASSFSRRAFSAVSASICPASEGMHAKQKKKNWNENMSHPKLF
jgi:hypothetical protein